MANKIISKYILTILILINLIIYYIIETFTENDLFIFIKIGSISIIFFLLVRAYLLGGKNIFNIIFLFHVTFFLFFYSNVFLDLLSIKDILIFNSISFDSFNKKDLIITIIIGNLSILFFNVFLKNSNLKSANLLIRHRPDYVQSGKIILLLFLPFVSIKYGLELLYILKNGYYSLYLGGFNEINYYSPLIKYSHIGFNLGYYGFITGMPSKKEFKKYSKIFLVISLLDSFKGARSYFILPLLFYFFFLSYFYGVKYIVKIKNISYYFITLLSLLVLLQIFSNTRFNRKYEFNTDLILYFLSSQGNSLHLTSFFIKYEDILNDTKLGYIFEPITFPINYILNYKYLSKGQNYETVRIRENYNHRLTYFLNESIYLRGGGLGSSYIVEMWQFGILGLVFFSFLLAKLVNIYFRQIHKPIMLFFSFIIITHILFLPRDHFFINFWDILKIVLIYCSFLLINQILANSVRSRLYQKPTV